MNEVIIDTPVYKIEKYTTEYTDRGIAGVINKLVGIKYKPSAHYFIVYPDLKQKVSIPEECVYNKQVREGLVDFYHRFIQDI